MNYFHGKMSFSGATFKEWIFLIYENSFSMVLYNYLLANDLLQFKYKMNLYSDKWAQKKSSQQN
ncbi:hypothetical protein BH09BAC5_BH09BAC5_00730 [soil metagenome]